MKSKEKKYQPAYRVKSLDKALSILKLMIDERQDQSLTEIDKKLNLGKGTVHRMLDTLRANQFVRQDPMTLKYGLGLLAFEMGSVIKKEEFIRKIIYPYLNELSESCPETISAAILEYNEIRYIARIESHEMLRVSIGEGTRFPAHCTATGKMLLAVLPKDYLERLYEGRKRLEKFTKNSIGSFSKLINELKRVKENDLAYDLEEALIGVRCLARPIRNSRNEVVAAISISGPKNRMTEKKISELAELLLGTTQRISKEL